MKKIILIAGKSSSGKDAISKALIKNSNLKIMTPCTTRPMRSEESELNPYHFIKNDEVDKKMIAKTVYKREDGIYYYGFLNEKLDNYNYLAVVNLAQINEICKMYQNDFKIVLIMIKTDEETRIIHAIERENVNDKNYKELCRRIITDAHDFSNENFDFINACHCVDEFNYIYNDYEMTPDEIAQELINNRKWEEL